MDALREYSIPFKGLGNGIHQFVFRIDKSFFEHFEQSPISDCSIELKLDFDKRSDLFVLEFDFSGKVKTSCDRCLVPIDLPISGAQSLLVKFSEAEEAEEAEVVYISPDENELNVSRFVYEFICLALPIMKTYDCENDEPRPCDMEMLRFLDNGKEAQAEQNPIWDELKDFKEGEN